MWNLLIKLIMIVIALLLLFYIISPIDFIPDFIPILGWIDDIFAALMLIPVVWKIIR